MDVHFLSNALAYSAQVAAIAVLGTLTSLLIRIDSARVRYAYWRTLVALCLLLPWLQNRVSPTPSGTSSATVAYFIDTAAVVSTAGSAGSSIDWALAIVAVLAGGVVLRLVWVGIGMARLRRLREAGYEADAGGIVAELQHLVGARAEVRFVAELSQPLTFGVRRPVILLPDRLRQQPDDVQRAVLSHELLHVKRRDWLWLLAEEVLRAALWFHPAIWWLIARVQLAREEVVDALAVSLLGTRRPYIQALMAFVDETPLAPAPAFARRHHLFRRILLVSKEAAMSPRRIAFASVVMAAVMATGTIYVVRAFPLAIVDPGQPAQTPVTAGSLEERVNPITPENPIPRRLAVVNPAYPAQFAGTGVAVWVSVRLVLDASGAVGEARVLSAQLIPGSSPNGAADLEPFRAAALDAARRWLYASPANPPISFTAVFTFREGATESSQGELRFSIAEKLTQAVPAAGPGRRSGPVPAPATPGTQTPTARGGVPAPGPPAAPPSPIRVGGNIRPPRQLSRVQPVYPPIALTARVEGVVILEVQIGADGKVTDARVVRSLPLLDQAAVDSVRQWEFEPTLLNGVPVPIIMTVTVQFVLPEPETVPQAN